MEQLLLVEDNPNIAEELKKSLINENFAVTLISSMDEYNTIDKTLLSQFDIGIFDIRLNDLDFNDTFGIEIAKLFNDPKPRPTLFITAYDSSNDSFYKRTKQEIKHSHFCSKSGENWVLNILNQINTTYELFASFDVTPKIIADRITFKPYGLNGRLFIKSDEIVLIFKKGQKSIFLTNTDEIEFSSNLDMIDNVIRKYKLKFIRINQSCIVNLDYIVLYSENKHLHLKPNKLPELIKLKNDIIFSDDKIGEIILKVGETYIQDRSFTKLFISLQSSRDIQE